MQAVWEAGARRAQSKCAQGAKSMRGNKVFPPTLCNPCQNIHSLPIKRETNKHTRLAVAILKYLKDIERVSLGLL